MKTSALRNVCHNLYTTKRDLDVICSLNVTQTSLLLFRAGSQRCAIRQWRRSGWEACFAVSDLSARLQLNCKSALLHQRSNRHKKQGRGSFQFKTVSYCNIASIVSGTSSISITTTLNTVLYLSWTTATIRLLVQKDHALKYHKTQSVRF